MRAHVLALAASTFCLGVANAGCLISEGPSSSSAPLPAPACASGAISSTTGSFEAFAPSSDGVLLGVRSGDDSTMTIAESKGSAGELSKLYAVQGLAGVASLSAGTGTVLAALGQLSGDSLESIPLGGGAPRTLLSSGPESLAGVATDGQTVYVVSGDAIVAVPSGGGAARVIYTTTNLPSQLVLDGTTLYWTEQGPDLSDQAIRSAPVSDALVATTVLEAGRRTSSPRGRCRTACS